MLTSCQAVIDEYRWMLVGVISGIRVSMKLSWCKMLRPQTCSWHPPRWRCETSTF